MGQFEIVSQYLSVLQFETDPLGIYKVVAALAKAATLISFSRARYLLPLDTAPLTEGKMILVSRGKGRIVSVLVILSVLATVLLGALEVLSQPFLFLGAWLTVTSAVAWIIGRPLNKALEKAYGLHAGAGHRFKLRDMFDVHDFNKAAPENPIPFHSFMFLKMEYSFVVFAVVGLAVFLLIELAS